MAKHTPGPWRVAGKASDCGSVRVMALDSWICDMPTAYDDSPGSADVVGIEADARLIAESPAMAEELRGWLAIFDRPDVSPSPLVRAAILSTRAVLAKATGQ